MKSFSFSNSRARHCQIDYSDVIKCRKPYSINCHDSIQNSAHTMKILIRVDYIAMGYRTDTAEINHISVRSTQMCLTIYKNCICIRSDKVVSRHHFISSEGSVVININNRCSEKINRRSMG